MGQAISYGQHALEAFKGIPSKFNPAVLPVIQALIQSFNAEFTSFKEKNRVIFLKVVPKYAPVPPAQMVECPVAADFWAEPRDVCGITDMIRRKAAAEIDGVVNAVKADADKAETNADSRLAKVPTALIQDLIGKVSTMNAQRTATRQLSAEVSHFIGSQPALLQRFQGLGQRLEQLQRALPAAAQKDLEVETQLAQANSIVDGIQKLAKKIETGKLQLAAARVKFDEAAEEARSGRNDKKAQLEIVGGEVKSAIAAINSAVALIDKEFETKLQHYQATAEAAKLGIVAATTFYEKAAQRFDEIKTTISGIA
jgi:hypothetical protein